MSPSTIPLIALCALLFLSQPPSNSGSPLATHFTVHLPDTHSTPLRGVTGEPCRHTSDCHGERRCVEESAPLQQIQCAEEHISCRCFPPTWIPCTHSADCHPRELCARLPESTALPPGVPNPLCVSAVITGHIPELDAVPGGPERNETSSSAGLTLFPCQSDAECNGERTCMYNVSPETEMFPCEPGRGCFCFPVQPQLCDEETQCETGELCAKVQGFQLCVAADAESALAEVSAIGDEKPFGNAENPFISGAADSQTPEPNTGGGRNGPRTMDGVTGDSCQATQDCDGDRICVLASAPLDLTPCEAESECLCAPRSGPKYCDTDKDCELREICTKMPDLADPLCISTVLVGYTEELTPMSDGSKAGRSPAAGFTLYPCISDNECEGNRHCVANNGGEPASCGTADSCFCFPPIPKICSESQECESREVCAKLPDIQMCVSEDAEATFVEIKEVSEKTEPKDPETSDSPNSDEETMSPPSSESGESDSTVSGSEEPESSTEGSKGQPSDDDDGDDNDSESSEGKETEEPEESPDKEDAESSPEAKASPSTSPSPGGTVTTEATCIDAEALGHLPASELVFSNHAWSRVLCDEEDSCATPGHMVTWNGEAMMMETYCSIVTCTERVMKVNSPRYKRGLRVKSKTKELEYTAFAARYETRAEEAMMAVAVRAGL